MKRNNCRQEINKKQKFEGGHGSQWFPTGKTKYIEIVGAIYDLPAEQHNQCGPNSCQNKPDWLCHLSGKLFPGIRSFIGREKG